MSFLQIGFLTALGALAIPIIVHLVFRQRPRRAELGTLRFLRVVLAHNARRRRIMRWLLLSLRMACVALIAFLFARPYWLAAHTAGDKRTTVVLIDQSASMELRADGLRLIERAVADARDLLMKAEAKDRFEIAFFDHAVHSLTSQNSDGATPSTGSATPAQLLDKLRASSVCNGGTDYGGAMAWARDILAKSPPAERRLHVYTDLQRSGLAWTELDALPDNVMTQVHDLGRPAVNNVAVVESRADRTWLRPSEQTTLHVSVYNGSPFSIEELPVVLRLTEGKNKIELRERAKIEPGSSQSLKFDLPPLAAGLWQGVVAAEAEDDLPLDNQRHVAVLASPPYQVLLVDGRSSPSPVLAATHFLEAALRLSPAGEASGETPFEPRTIAADEMFPTLDKYDAVVLADVGAILAGTADQIRRFVARGGALLIFGGENLTPSSTASLLAAGLLPGQITGTSYADDLPFRLKHWDTKHPIFAAFSDPQLGDLSRLAFSARTQLQPASGATVLATFRDGAPAVVEQRLEKGTVVWLAITADRSWSDWTSSRLYLPLVYQLIGYQTGLLAGGRVRQAALETGASGTIDLRPGIYERDGYTLVVNAGLREAETERCTVEEFAGRFGLKLDDETATVQSPTATAAMGTELIDSEVWPWLASLLLVGLVLEAAVANRTVA